MVKLAIIGCGRVGSDVLAACPPAWTAVGLRRDAAGDQPRILAGDGADPAALARLEAALGGPPDLLLIAASPGLRGGGDNGLEAVASQVVERWPGAAALLCSSTAVYGDAGGGPVDEQGPLSDGRRQRRLLAIEHAVQALDRHLILRIGGLVGPGRQTLQQRLAERPCRLRGDPERPFSYCHHDDAVTRIIALLGRLALAEPLPALLNCTAPARLTYAAYARSLAAVLGLDEPEIVGDGSSEPRRQVVSSRLDALLPDLPWHDPFGLIVS